VVVDFENLTPYLSIVLLKIVDDSFNLNSLRNELTPTKKEFNIKEYDDDFIYYVNYQDKKRASWTDDEKIQDIKNQVLIIYRIDNYIALYHSDTTKKAKIYRLILHSPNKREFKKIQLLNKETLYTAFLKDVKVKNLWLKNVHDSSDMKAYSKILSGDNLEEALDPLGDQAYGFSAIKVKHEDGLSIGVNASCSKIWMKNFSDNIIFFDEIKFILRKVQKIEDGNEELLHNPIDMLANSHTDISILGKMIDITLNFIEEIDCDSEKDKFLSKVYDKWDTYIFEFNKVHDIYNVKILDNTKTICHLSISFSVDNAFVNTNVIVSSEYENHKCFWDLFNNYNLNYFFLNSQTIMNRQIYKREFKDITFNNFQWLNFNTFDVSKEKPSKNDFSLIGNDDSLFSWIKKYWTGLDNDNLVNYEQDYVNGWLLCDDGAGEKADFIHITDEDIPTISLIHAKGANSNGTSRRIAVTAYEVVVSQAVKNIKYLHKNSISLTIENANRNVENLVWHNGIQSNRIEIKNYLENLEQYNKRVVVLQPHVKKEKYVDINISESAKLQRNLLSNLLVSAQNTVHSVNAEFVVIGEC